ncbi:MAG: 3-phosphoshikimate 1-carboxyvinyltransferase [Burkholderiales bacterium]
MKYLELLPIERAAGTVRLPGSKSISNRTLLLAALAEGDTIARDVLSSDDTHYMLQALRVLGVDCAADGAHNVHIRGSAGRFPVTQAELFLGNAGTAFRPLTAVLAILGGDYRLSGVPRMHERPIGDLVDALRSIGASIDYLGEPGYPPLQIHPGRVDPGRGVKIRGNVSSQFVTGLLMALPLTGLQSTVEIEGELISKPYVEMTLKTMRLFGVAVEHPEVFTFAVKAGQRYRSPGEIFVEGDASSASYFLAAGVISGLTGGGPVRVEGVGRDSIQGDIRFTEVLEQMGGRITMGNNWIEAAAGAEAVKVGRLRPLDADLNHIPDAAMTAAVAALFAQGTSTLRNIGSWRVKETDRLAAMANELRKLGAMVEEGPDYLRITPPATLTPHAEIDTYDDHRIAMSFALATLGGVPLRINEPECVRKTFPDYFDVLGSISSTASAP